MNTDSNAPDASPANSRFNGLYRVLLGIAAVVAIVVFVFPAAFPPAIEPPEDVQFGSPFSVGVQISNQNVTPLTDVVYTCAVSTLKLADGSTVANAKVLTRGAIRRIRGRQGAPARCEMAYIQNAPLQAAEYQLTLQYRAYPWPKLRTSVYRIAAKLNGKGEVTGWKAN